MNKQQLINELRYSLPSRRMLEVVNIGVVRVGDELVILKQRPNYELNEDTLITYNQYQDWDYQYKELIAKSVIFDHSLIGFRGRKAIAEYLTKAI